MKLVQNKIAEGISVAFYSHRFQTVLLLLSVLFIAGIGTHSTCSGQVYVNDDNVSGPWDGTMANPFMTISDGITSAGQNGTVFVAQGLYTEQVLLLPGQQLKGGYSDNWLQNDWQTYPTHVTDPDYSQHMVNLSSGTIFDGFHVNKLTGFSLNAVQGIDCQDLIIRNCDIQAAPFDQPYSTPGSDGSSIAGIYLENCAPSASGVIIENVTIRSVEAGNGVAGEYQSILHGGNGGDGIGIELTGCSSVAVSNVSIVNISAGSGGTGSTILGGSGGNGGNAFGIIAIQSPGLALSNCFVQEIYGGRAGYGRYGSYFSGNGGAATAMHFDDCDHLEINHSVISYCQAGDGVRTVMGGRCGSGGQATGLFMNNSVATTVQNMLITNIRGGCGNEDFNQCEEAGNGGDAIGVQSLVEYPVIRNLTVSLCIGGDGGMGDGTVAGGDGGDGSGLWISAVGTDQLLYNIVSNCFGGAMGEPDGNPGTGAGVKSTGAWFDVAYHDSWQNDYDYLECGPGTGSFSLDPLFAELSGFPPFYLSETLAGQSATSPCVDAADIPAGDLFDPLFFTTRTDHVEDTDTLDLGFHFAIDSTPLPTCPPYSTPAPTVTAGPTSTPFPTSTPEPTAEPTSTMTPIPTITPTQEPSPTCPPSSVNCVISDNWFMAGDRFYFGLEICNEDSADIPAVLAVALEVAGEFYFYPDWRSQAEFVPITVPGCDCLTVDILDFTWPECDGGIETVRLWGAVLEADSFDLFDDYCMVEFGF